MMETVEDGEQPKTNAHISDIPEEVLELIFGHLSPYEDMKSVMLVCKQWHRVVSGQYFISVCRCVESLLLNCFCALVSYRVWHCLWYRFTGSVSCRLSRIS